MSHQGFVASALQDPGRWPFLPGLRWPFLPGARTHSEGRRFGVGAKHLLKRRHHLTFGGLGAGRLEQVRHEVLRWIARCPLEALERVSGAPALAALADGLHPLDLVDLEGWID